MRQRYHCLQERLLVNSIVDLETDCWLWTGAVDSKGYGKITLRVRRFVGKGRKKKEVNTPVGHRVHRVAYELFKEEKIPEGMTVDHLACVCPYKNCFNPGHLEVVTVSVNSIRMQNVRRYGRNWDQVAFI
jgi:hypothetical protein